MVLIHHSSKSDCCLEHTAAPMQSHSPGTWQFGGIVRTITLDSVIGIAISILKFWETDPISLLLGPSLVYTCVGHPKLNEADENNVVTFLSFMLNLSSWHLFQGQRQLRSCVRSQRQIDLNLLELAITGKNQRQKLESPEFTQKMNSFHSF